MDQQFTSWALITNILPHKNGDPDEEKRIYLRCLFSGCFASSYILLFGQPSPYIKGLVASAPLDQKAVDVLDMMLRGADIK